MKLYHGTDQVLYYLKSGSSITKRLKDAWKFAYRKAVLNGSSAIYIYEVEDSQNFERDFNRDGAFKTVKPSRIRLVEARRTFDAPYKLRTFSLSMRP